MKIILSTAYHASIQYYSKFMMGKPIVIEQYDTYAKQSYRNRCMIATSEGTLALSVPVVYSSKEQTKVKDVHISEHDNWQHTHWNAFQSAYNSTPFFEYYKDDFEYFYTHKFDSLLQFNDMLLRLTLSLLKVKIPPISYSDEYIVTEGDNKHLDYRSLIHPKQDYRQDMSFTSNEYHQVFGERNGFIPNMSILDLLFNMGNESLLVLLHSVK